MERQVVPQIRRGGDRTNLSPPLFFGGADWKSTRLEIFTVTTPTLFFLCTLLRLPAVLGLSGLCRTVFYDQMADSLWTQPVSIGSRAVAWPAHEIAAVIAARVSAQTDEQIRALVRELEAARKNAPKTIAEMCVTNADQNAVAVTHQSDAAYSLRTTACTPHKHVKGELK